MLKLRDFVHLPEVDTLFERLVADDPGLILLAGIEARPSVLPSSEVFRPSGLSGLFNILMQEILLARPHSKAVVIAKERSLAKVPRQLARRVSFVRVEPPFSYPGQIELAIVDRPDLLVIDHLSEEALPAAFHAAQSGLRVLTQFDTVLRGPAVARQLVELGASQEQLQFLRWIITSQRISVLCDRCKLPVENTDDIFQRLRSRYPQLGAAIDSLQAPAEEAKRAVRPVRQPGFYRAGGCEQCRSRGYSGDISAFDIFNNDTRQESLFVQSSVLPLEEYMLRLAYDGQADVMDLLDLESGHLRQVYQLLTTSERALVDSNATLNRKLVELEASNRVLVQRTEVLMSLQDLGQALITSVELDDLAGRVCRRAGELCGADRVVLYLRRAMEDRSEVAEILAERGWGLGRIGVRLEAREVFGVQSAAQQATMRASRYTQTPPGFRSETAGSQEANNPIKTGLQVPLFAQEQLVGIMIVQSTQKDFFSQGEMALLQTFANQAALAIQRAGLVEELREKIAQLEAAQAELVTKERMARELELARQVQQDMLPHSFPAVPGYALSARNEPARQVGGDFYDVILLDEDHFGVVVADVADKGLPAALYMALTRSLLLAEARRTLSPRETLLNVNRLLLELGELNGFVSIFYGVVHSSSRCMTYARAGHERPLLLRDGEVSSLSGEGAVLGILDDLETSLTEEQARLNPGDRLILYTDGLTDVLDSAGHFSGHDQLQRLLRLHAREDAEGVCSALFNALAVYRGPVEQFDDMTMLVLEVK